MIIYRPHRKLLEDSIKEQRCFKSLQQMLEYIVDEHNKSQNFFKISDSDLNISLYSKDGDERVNWRDLFVVCFESYDRINDKVGYKKYFGEEEYDHPVGVLGFFTTDFDSGHKIQEWTLWNERRPKDGESCLLCTKDGKVGEGRYYRVSGDVDMFRWQHFRKSEDILAWMLLPEPYKG